MILRLLLLVFLLEVELLLEVLGPVTWSRYLLSTSDQPTSLGLNVHLTAIPRGTHLELGRSVLIDAAESAEESDEEL